jgi:FtsP/CotA-like multicopper oxidase with cupredoxin domain
MLAGVALLVASLLIGGTAVLATANPAVVNSTPAALQLSTLPATTCTYAAGTSTRTCDLWATTGTITLPVAGAVTVWGYALDSTSPAQIPGPTLIVNQGEKVVITLHNKLSQPTSLSFPSQAIAPDTVGAAASTGTATYTFTAGAPGTQIYEAGLTPNGPRQVALGMFGALIVRPTSGATNLYDANTAFNDEAVLVFSEVDPALNAAPTNFNMTNYSPKYWLINGHAYPDTAEISTAPGNKVALRYVNVGLKDHSIGALGLSKMTVAGTDGRKLDNSYDMTAETITSGETMDVLTTIPASAPNNSRFALYNGARHLDNNGKSDASHVLNFGGMLTFLKVSSTTTGGGDTTGPVTSNVALSPLLSNGSSSLSLTAQVSDATTGNGNVTEASYFIDSTGGTGTAMTGTFGTPTVNVSATIPTSALSSLTTGNHTLYVRGKDAAGNFGALASVVFTIDKVGPGMTGSVSPASSTGAQTVSFAGTANDSANGNSKVVAYRYRIDNGSNTTVNVAAADQNPVYALGFDLPAATVSALSEGKHMLNIETQDEVLNWGATGSFSFTIDKTKPTISTFAVTPNPNNGTLVVDVNNLGVKVTATATDPLGGGANSNVVAAELFIETVKADGTGLPLQPVDGSFNSPTENAYALILLTDGIQNMTQGAHPIYIHAKDAAGNWGSTTQVNLIIDKTAPTVSGASVSPNPTNGAASVTLSATATDPANTAVAPATIAGPASNIAAAEWFEGTDPGVGLATPMNVASASATSTISATINTSGLATGNHTVQVRAKDAAGNWSATTSVTFNVVPPVNIFADSFESGNTSAWNGGATGNPTVNTAAKMTNSGTYGMQVNANATSYVTDNTPNNDTRYRARFYFNPHGATTGTNNNNAQDIFVGYNSANQVVFRVQYHRTTGNVYQVRVIQTRNFGSGTGNWYNINNNAANYIEISWTSGTNANGALSLSINGTVQQTLTGTNTLYTLDYVRLGSVTPVAGSTGTEYFDAFVSTRGTTVIGP